VSEEAEKASAEVAPNDEIVGSIDGVSLLGIFGSGEVAGVIIRLDNGERQRLPVGHPSRAGHCGHWNRGCLV